MDSRRDIAIGDPRKTSRATLPARCRPIEITEKSLSRTRAFQAHLRTRIHKIKFQRPARCIIDESKGETLPRKEDRLIASLQIEFRSASNLTFVFDEIQWQSAISPGKAQVRIHGI